MAGAQHGLPGLTVAPPAEVYEDAWGRTRAATPRAEGERRKLEAIERVGKNAPEEWMAMASAAVETCALSGEPFTTDDVWSILERAGHGSPPEPRAMGAVIRRAVTSGLIRETGNYIKSERPECHRRPIPQWVGVR